MVYELDLKDSKILFELDKNSRKSYSEIAKKVGVSKQVVKFRVERMIERGIIEEFITTWNIGALGYTDYAILFKFKGATKDDENQIINYFKESNNVSWVVSTEGQWDLLINTRWKTIADYFDFLQQFTYKFGGKIKARTFYFRTRLSYFNRKYLIEEKIPKEISRDIFVPAEKAELDEIDIKIGLKLSKNSRATLQELAKEAGITPEAVSYRIKRLEKLGLIHHWIRINLEKIGFYYFKAIFSLRNITAKRLQDFVGYGETHPNVIYLIQEIGLADVHFDFEVKGRGELRKIMDEIREKFPDIIDSCEILTITKEHKLNYSLIT